MKILAACEESQAVGGRIIRTIKEGTVKPHRVIRQSNRVGDPSSKYAYDGCQLDSDIAKHIESHNRQKKYIMDYVVGEGMTPDEAVGLFRCIYEEYEKAGLITGRNHDTD